MHTTSRRIPAISGALALLLGFTVLLAVISFLPDAALGAEVGSISGVVTIEGAPVADLPLEVGSTGESPFLGMTTTGLDGSFSVGGLPDGDYVVQFCVPDCGPDVDSGDPPLSEWFNNAHRSEDAALVSVVGGAAVAGVNADLTYGGSISGRVGDDTFGLSGQGMDVYREDGSLLVSDTTDEIGTYRFDRLEPGTYFVHFTNRDVWFDGAASLVGADPVIVVDGADTGDIGFLVDLAGSISGTVSGQGGPMLSGIGVDLHTDQWTVVQSTSTAADGSCTFSPVDSGVYYVKAHDPRGGYADTWYGDPGDRFDMAYGVIVDLDEDVTGKDITMFVADIGERIDLLPWVCTAADAECFFGEVEFAAGKPFHVVHGWVNNTPDDTRDILDPGTRFDLYLDGVLLPGEELIERIDDLTTKSHRYIFPHGLTGRHVLWGVWLFLDEFDADSEVIVTSTDRGTFLDDDDSVFETDIEWMAAEGITKGCNPPTNDRFCPEVNVTRGQMAAFLVRALNLTERLDNSFTDDDDSIFEADIERLAAAGITKGCNPPVNDRFCPDGKVTREQMAAFLVRALGYTDNGGGDLFVDDDASIFEADIDRMGTAGVTKGCNPPTNDRYCPTGNVTRGQMAAFIHRALG